MSSSRTRGVSPPFSLKPEGHGHAKVGVVNEAVGEHEVDGDDWCKDVDLANKNESHGHQAGQDDGCHWSFVGAFLPAKQENTRWLVTFQKKKESP